MRSPIVVVGAGGHAKVCIETLRAAGESVGWCIGGGGGPATCAGVAVLAGDHHLKRLRGEGFDRCFVAIGDNATRHRLAASAVEAGFGLVNAIHPGSAISPSVRLGTGIAVMAGAVINAETVVSDLAIVNTLAAIDHDCQVGHAAHVAPRTAAAGGVRIGAYSFLGIGSSIVPGIAIGERAMIGAGAVVIADVPDGATMVGVPARPLRR